MMRENLPRPRPTKTIPYWLFLQRVRRRRALLAAAAVGAFHAARMALVVLALASQIYITPYAYAADVLPSTLPQGGTVVVGDATIAQPTTTHLQITTRTQRTGINWNSFDIGRDGRVSIAQPDATSLTLNRVKNGQLTKIFGKLDSNGRVVVANPAGVWFGPDSHVDVAGLVAAAADIDPASVTGNSMTADASQATAGVLADGAIVVTGAGGAALVGRSVEQRGSITAPGGQVTMSAADSFSISLRADGRLEVQTTKAATQLADLPDGRTPAAAVAHSGNIDARGGRVTLAADVAHAALDEAINVSHHASADRARVVGDVIELVSSGDGTVRVKATLMADASNDTGNGGNVRVYGKNVAFEQGAVASAHGGRTSGKGGTILIGGDYQGQRTADAPARNAERTYIAEGATLDASAQSSGDGGKVVVWADKATHYAGDAKATGGTHGGNGGLIEVSGYETLGFYGSANVAAPLGQQGRILLDPRDITIAAAGPDDGNIGSYVFFANPNTTTDVTFSAAAIQALTGAVQIQASRNIIINSALDFSNVATTSVAFRAGQNITINAPVQATGGASLAFTANDPGSTTRLATATITVGANIGGATTGAISFSNSGGSGALNLTANSIWQTNNASVTVTMTGSQIRADAGNNNRTLTVNAGSGTVSLGNIGTGTTVPGSINITGGQVTVGNVITGTTALTRAGGDFVITASGVVSVGSITTVGGRIGNVGQAGGLVNIAGTVIDTTAINTTGNAAAGAASNGGAGGAVTLNATTGNVGFTSITTTGGNATTTGAGGAGGTVTVTAAGGTVNAAGNITTVGGNTANAAGTNGAGGNITINNNFNVAINANTTFNSAGGSFVAAGDGLGGTQTYAGTFNFAPGGNRTLTFTANNGAVNFSNTTINLTNTSNIVITADSFVLPAGVASITLTGTVTVQPYTPTITKGVGIGAAGAWQFTQDNINAFSTSISTLTIGSASGTGLMTIDGNFGFNSDNITIRNAGNGGDIVFAATADMDMALSGNRILTLQSGNNAADHITFMNGAVLTNASGATGNTVFATNNLILNGPTGAINGNGAVTFQGSAAGTTVGFNGAAGVAQFTQAHLDAMPSFVTINIGNTGLTNTVSIAGAIDNGGRQLAIRAGGAGGNIVVTGTTAITMSGANRQVLFVAGTNATDALTIQNGATITNNTGATGSVVLQANTLNANAAAGALTGNGTLTIQTIGNANTMGIGTGAGQLSVTQAVLDQFSGFVSQTFGRGHTVALNIDGAVNFTRTTTITSNGGNGSVVFGGTADVTFTGGAMGFTVNTGSGTGYAANINSLVMNPGARITNTTGGNLSFVTNNIVAGDDNAITGAAVITIQPTADNITTVIGTGAGSARYSAAALDMLTGFTSQTFGRAAGTVQLGVGGNVLFERTTTLRASGNGGSIRFYSGADVQVAGSDTVLNINTGTGTTYAADINTWSVEAGASLTNNTGASSAVVYTGNNINFDGTATITGNGIMTIQPTATTTTLGVGVGATGAAQYSAASIARITGFSLLNIGRADSTVAMGIAGALHLNTNTLFRMAGGNGAINAEASADVTVGGTDTAVTFQAGSGTGGTAAQNVFTMANGASIVNNSGAAGQVIIDSNKLAITAGANLAGNGALFIQPRSTGQSVGIGTGAGGLSINNTALAAISGFTSQTFGLGTGTSLMTVDGAVAIDRATLLRMGGASGDITFVATAALIVAGANSLEIQTGTGTNGVFTFVNGAALTMGSGTLTINANTIALAGVGGISGAGQLVVQQVEDNMTMGFGGGAGQLSLTAAHLAAFSGFDTQIFGRTTSTATITAAATTFDRTTTIRSDSGALTTTGAIDITAAGEDLTFDTTGLITLGNDITTNNGNISIGSGLIVLNGNVIIDSNNGDIAFANTINSTGGTRNLTVDAGTGAISFAGALGDSTPLGTVSLAAAGGLALPAITTTGGGLSVALASGILSQTGALTIDGNATFDASTAVGQDIILSNAANDIAGNVILLTDMATGGAVIYTEDGNIVLGDSISGDNMTITSVTGSISQAAASTLNVAGDLGAFAVQGSFSQGAGASFTANGLGMELLTAPTLNAGNTFGRIAAHYLGVGEAFSLTYGAAMTVDTVAGVIGINADTVFLRTTAGDITLNQDVVASGAGNAVVLASAAGFANNAGADGIQPGTGRYIIYSNTPVAPNTVLGGLTPAKQYNRTFAGYAPGAVVEPGDRIFYSIVPTLTLTANDASRAEGAANPAFTFSVSNTFIDSDDASTALAGSPAITTAANPASPQGTYAITITQGGLSSPLRYNLVFANGTLTVTAPVVVPSNPTPTVDTAQIIPSLIYTSQPSRVLEVASAHGLEAAIEEDARILGRMPTGLILPFDSESNGGDEEEDIWGILPTRSRIEY